MEPGFKSLNWKPYLLNTETKWYKNEKKKKSRSMPWNISEINQCSNTWGITAHRILNWFTLWSNINARQDARWKGVSLDSSYKICRICALSPALLLRHSSGGALSNEGCEGYHLAVPLCRKRSVTDIEQGHIALHCATWWWVSLVIFLTPDSQSWVSPRGQ